MSDFISIFLKLNCETKMLCLSVMAIVFMCHFFPAAGCTFEEDSDPNLCDFTQGEEDDFDWLLFRTYSSPYASSDLLRGEWSSLPQFYSLYLTAFSSCSHFVLLNVCWHADLWSDRADQELGLLQILHWNTSSKNSWGTRTEAIFWEIWGVCVCFCFFLNYPKVWGNRWTFVCIILADISGKCDCV